MLNHVLIQPCFSLYPIKWYEPMPNAQQVLAQFPDMTFSHLEYDSYAWPGGYEIHYYTKDGGVLCHECANAELERTIDPDDPQFYIVDESVNYEDPNLFCDHCNRKIGPEYEVEEESE